MIVEEHGMDFWTGVQLPSSPLEAVETNCRSIAQLGAFRNIVSIVLATNNTDIPKKPSQLTFSSIQKWIEGMYGVKVSKSSITQVKNKCKIDKIEFGAKGIMPELQTEKEKLVLKAFEHFKIVGKEL